MNTAKAVAEETMKLGLAVRTLFRVLGDTTFARQVKELMDGAGTKTEKAAPTRREALTLLATFQREGRLIDFLMEDIKGYSDAQIGAAVRDIHRDCAATMQRMFAMEPLTDLPEGGSVEVPAGFDPAMYHLTGAVAGEAPFKGTVRHHGWKAAKCDVPEWTGRDDSLLVAAPIDVEI